MTKLEMLQAIGVGFNENKTMKQNDDDVKIALKKSKATIEYAYNIWLTSYNKWQNGEMSFENYCQIQNIACMTLSN